MVEFWKVAMKRSHMSLLTCMLYHTIHVQGCKSILQYKILFHHFLFRAVSRHFKFVYMIFINSYSWSGLLPIFSNSKFCPFSTLFSLLSQIFILLLLDLYICMNWFACPPSNSGKLNQDGAGDVSTSHKDLSPKYKVFVSISLLLSF